MAPPKTVSDKKRLEILIRKRENEKKRLEKIKSDPILAAQLKEKERLKYLKKKERGKVKAISELSHRDQRKQRKQWKTNQRNSRSRKETIKKTVKNDNLILEQQEPSTSTSSVEIYSDGRKAGGRKRVRRARTRLARELKKTKDELLQAKRTSEKYKKKFYRLREKFEETPRKKVKKMTNNMNVSLQVKKKLIYGEVVTNKLVNGYSLLKNQKSKQIFKGIMKGDLFKKYKLLKEAKPFLSSKKYTYMNAFRLKEFYGLKYGRKQHNGFVLTNQLKTKVADFLKDDVNSRMCPGKKDCLTLKKTKIQKRYLNDTLQNLYEKFKLACPEYKLSYTSFTRLKPFWIVAHKASERDTCLCIIHSNMDMMVKKLYELDIVPDKNIDSLMKSVCCENKRECLQRSCKVCKNHCIQFNQFDGTVECSYSQWKSKTEFYTDKKSGEKKTCRKTMKQKQVITSQELVKEFEDELPKYMYHVANQYHQHSEMKKLKEDLGQHEVIIHVDFSENYVCKYAEEVQSVHFVGGQQITLHTGVLYFKDIHGEMQLKSFCTLSQSLRHDAAAIWAHLNPIIKQHLNEYPYVATIHGLSDSPSNQYRNKTVFNSLQYFARELPYHKSCNMKLHSGRACYRGS